MTAGLFTDTDVQRYAKHIVGHPDAAVDARHLAATRAILDALAADGRLLAADQTDLWLIWSHEANTWWGPNGSRYVADITQAGRYSHDDAVKRAGIRSWRSDIRPPEVVIPAPTARVLASPEGIRAYVDEQIKLATNAAIRARRDAKKVNA